MDTGREFGAEFIDFVVIVVDVGNSPIGSGTSGTGGIIDDDELRGLAAAAAAAIFSSL